MGAAQHERVGARSQQRLQHRAHRGVRLRRVRCAGFHQLHPAAANILQHARATAVALHQAGIARAAKCGGRCQHRHNFARRTFNRRLDRRLHAHKQQLGKLAAQMLQGTGGGCVASHHHQPRLMHQQKARHLLCKGAHFRARPRAVRHARLVGQVHQRLGGQQLAHSLQHTQPAQPRVKNANRLQQKRSIK